MLTISFDNIRGRADRRRVQALIQQQREERARKEAERMKAVKNWKEEIEREAEEWRAAFLRKQEEDELEVQLTVQFLIDQTANANEKPSAKQETEKKEVKSPSAYQLEWDRLNSFESSENNTESGGSSRGETERKDEKVDEINIEDKRGEEEEEEEEEKKAEKEDNNDANLKNDPKESLEVASLVLESIIINAFEDIHKRRDERRRELLRKEETSRRMEIISIVKDLIDRIQVDHDKSVENEISKVPSPPTTTTTTSSPPEEDNYIKETVNSLLIEIITNVEEKSSTSANITKLEEKIEGESPERMVKTPEPIPESKEEVHQSESKESLQPDGLMQSDTFRATLPAVEVDAVAGFFQEQRSAIRTLQSEKSRMKASINKYKKKFQKKYGHAPRWSEMTKEMKTMCEDYQEVLS